MRRPAVAGLYEPMVVASREEQDRLAGGGVDDGANVAHDQRPPGQAAQVNGFEVREEAVVTLDRHHSLIGFDRVRLVECVDPEVRPAALPDVVTPTSGAQTQN